MNDRVTTSLNTKRKKLNETDVEASLLCHVFVYLFLIFNIFIFKVKHAQMLLVTSKNLAQIANTNVTVKITTLVMRTLATVIMAVTLNGTGWVVRSVSMM
jgi:hypothetical protein